MKKHVGISTPCSEDRSKMIPLENADFCKKCAMEVQDFSDLSPEEIKLQLYLRMNQSICARMTKDQEDALNRDFLAWKVSKRDHMNRAMVFSLFLVFGLTLFSCSNQDAKIAFTSAHENFVKSVEENIITITEDVAEIEKDPMQVEEEGGTAMDSLEAREVPLKSCSSEDSLIITNLPEGRDIMIAGGIGWSKPYNEYLEEPQTELLQNVEKTNFPELFEAKAFPNPTRANAQITVDLPEGTTSMKIVILNMEGKILETIYSGQVEPSTAEFAVNLSEQVPGAYLVSIRTNNNSQTLRLIKQ